MSFDLISNIEKNSNKTKFQLFEVTLGIEKFKAAVPFDNFNSFYNDIMESRPETKNKLLAMLNKYQGRFE